ncbi:division plane positioning ATPase MipZ [Parasphingorhabdus sp. DH2-15]|uniref:division plane positioning ATPase MipZ n=1 Tax=Parasphingorhabdus sp. DH2-15 TaxID=3444112 RepID=UPI003F688689
MALTTPRSDGDPHYIVFANEKGGTGKSTSAVHLAVSLAYRGFSVGVIDLDPRQRTSYRYLENRAETMARIKADLPIANYAVFEYDSLARLDQMIAKEGQGHDFLIFDTPGRDDKFARYVATCADTLVTPMNDSFVDFDLIGSVDPQTFKVKRISFYAELIFEARKARAQNSQKTMDWVVMRNRVQHVSARNMQRMEDALAQLSKRVGFRIIPGLSERVIYRELFPSGLTLLDKGYLGDLGTSHILARQELRQMVTALHLPGTQVEKIPAQKSFF